MNLEGTVAAPQLEDCGLKAAFDITIAILIIVAEVELTQKLWATEPKVNGELTK